MNLERISRTDPDHEFLYPINRTHGGVQEHMQIYMRVGDGIARTMHGGRMGVFTDDGTTLFDRLHITSNASQFKDARTVNIAIVGRICRSQKGKVLGADGAT